MQTLCLPSPSFAKTRERTQVSPLRCHVKRRRGSALRASGGALAQVVAASDAVASATPKGSEPRSSEGNKRQDQQHGDDPWISNDGQSLAQLVIPILLYQ